MKRRYYSVRTGKHKPGTELSLQLLKDLFWAVYHDFDKKQYFDQAFGFECVDAGHVEGSITDVPLFFFRSLRKNNLWPIGQHLARYSEEDLFDVIELLHDVISKPLDGTMHSWNDCGMHYKTFDSAVGQEEFRSEINDILGDYPGSYRLANNGEIRSRGEKGFEKLLSRKLPPQAQEDVGELFEEAIGLFLRHHSSLTDRHNAVRMLADILEQLRPSLKSVLTKRDEADLFEIVNNFGIRHNNDRQKND